MVNAGCPCGIVSRVVLRSERLQPELSSRQPARHREVRGNEQLITHQAIVAGQAAYSTQACAEPAPSDGARKAQAGAAAAMAVACGQLWVARRETRPSRAGDSRSSSAATRSS